MLFQLINVCRFQRDVFLSINNITHTRQFVHAFLTGKLYSAKISVTFSVTKSPSFPIYLHHSIIE
ncbi:hypothetical protein DW021_17440 [Blautia obeum]|uniref:Uncharacterized protein n=1 Tax=Blautia obeum TaxID=40520 RepID=A0A415L1U7_9FIRM|nr:hypothetical protein DW021_17440 [Blautia obeum]